MLVRLATADDKPAWLALSQEYDKYISQLTDNMDVWYQGFDEYMDTKIKKNEAIIAIDRISGQSRGIIAFSKINNRISFFALSERANFTETSERLLLVALRQLNTGMDISVQLPPGICDALQKEIAFFEKHGFVISGDAVEASVKVHKLIRRATNETRGASFHYDYDNYARKSQKEHCPPCNQLPMPDGQIDIAELNYSWATAEYPGQARLFGKMHILAKMHVVDFEEMPQDEMAGFMAEVQIVGKALHKVTGAIKINYEIHANSGPHIHIHLFPRYLDDDFPSAPIDYRINEPSPYESRDEYLWFVERMRCEIMRLKELK
jgi:hypothetical protein